MATTTTARSGVFTYDDFYALVRDDQKGDLIDGVIYLTPTESVKENDLFGWLLVVIGLYIRKRKLGRLFGSRVACRLDDKNSPEPDILFVANKNRDRLHRGGVEGPPDLAIEIVSPESVERDYVKKRRQYQQFGIPEYWIIDEDERKVTLLRLDARGKYREIAPRKGIFHSQALKGFWLGSLTPESFDLEANPPVVTLSAAHTKNRKLAALPLRRDLAAQLVEWLRGRAPGAVLFPIKDKQVNYVIKADLEAAGAPYVKDGRTLDFHALRVSFVTHLALGGMPLAVAQKLARHSDSRLTANVYTHLGLADLSRAVESLPPLPGAAPATDGKEKAQEQPRTPEAAAG